MISDSESYFKLLVSASCCLSLATKVRAKKRDICSSSSISTEIGMNLSNWFYPWQQIEPTKWEKDCWNDSVPIVLFSFCWFYLLSWIEPIRQIHSNFCWYWGGTANIPFLCPYLCSQQLAATDVNEKFKVWFRVWYHIRTLIKRKRKSARERKYGFYMLLHLILWKFLNE